jgi:replicative DNA helicase
MIDSVTDTVGTATDLRKARRREYVSASDPIKLNRIPPCAFETEQAVIGCCLNTPVESIPEAQTILSDKSFYDHRNKAVWGIVTAMSPDSVNVITVRRILKEKELLDKIGGDNFLSECQDKAVSSAMLPVWIEELQAKQNLRAIISVCTNFVGKAYETSESNELLDELERSILAIRPMQSGENDIKSLVQLAINEIEHRCLAGDSLTGLSTGLIDLDQKTDGLHKGEMIVISGFPSTGKTALAVNIAVTNAIAKIPAAIFSAEMRPVKLVVRSICSESRINFFKIRTGDIPRMTNASATIAGSNLHIEQANRLTIGQVTAIARRLKQKHDIKLAAVDYIQLLTGHGDNREQEISSISKGIKAMALELEIPVLALSQLTDDGKLRESRAIGQDADSVWKLVNDGEWQPMVQPVNLLIEKCRDGATGKVELTFLKEFTRFENKSKVDDNDMP